MVFIDSFQFMGSSLNKLVSNLPNDVFKYAFEEIKNDKILKLIKQKGVYPYDYMDSFNRFSERKLPTEDDFYSILRTTVPFVTAHFEMFHCTHHPVIPKSDLYFTFCSTLTLLAPEGGCFPPPAQ